MWTVQGQPIDATRFLPFEPLLVLNHYDGPRIFTLRDRDGALCLACWSDEGDKQARFLIVPTSESVVAELLAGTRGVRDALNQPTLWVVDVNDDGTLAGAWSVAADAVPDDAQPHPGVTLHRELREELRRRVAEDDADPDSAIPWEQVKGQALRRIRS